MQLKRRALLKTGLAGAGLMLGAAAAEISAASNKSQQRKEYWDVVVVGAGFAGMCAALEAAEQGAKVVLLEKMSRPDGTTVYSSG